MCKMHILAIFQLVLRFWTGLCIMMIITDNIIPVKKFNTSETFLQKEVKTGQSEVTF